MNCKILNISSTGLVHFAIVSLLVAACSGSEPAKRNAPQSSSAPGGAQAGNAQASGGPVANASPTPVPSSSGSCEDQWAKHIATFKVGSKLTYLGTVTSASPLMTKAVPIQHTEEVTSSTDSEVDRKVVITSTDAFVANLLKMMMIPENLPVKKSNFLAMCQKASDAAVNTVTFAGGDIQVVETRDDSLVQNGQTKAARFMRLKGNVTAMGAAVAANIQVWISKDTPGLVLKQITDLTNVPLVSAATMTDELSSSTGL